MIDMKKEKRYIELILKSWAGTLTLAEKRELEKLLKREEWAKLKGELENDRVLMGRFKEYGKYDTTGDFLLFLERVRTNKKITRKQRSVLQIVTYAACFICLIMASWIFMHQGLLPVHSNIAKVPPMESIDRNSIRLILDNDSMIALSGESETKKLDTLGVAFVTGIQTLDYTRVKRDTLIDSLAYHTLIVPKGCVFNIVLEDSTKVYLNAETVIKYPRYFAGNMREVYVEGEAYFEVNRDEERPFIVKGNNFFVEVLGTSFDIMNYENEHESRVTLLSGRVKMCTGDTVLQLTPGEQLSLSVANEVSIQRVNAKNVISWMDRKFNFEGETLEVIMKKICRWYDVEVLFEKPSLRESRFTGTPPNCISLQELLDEFLNHTTDIEFTLQNGVISVKELKHI